MTELVYLTDSYKKELKAKIISLKKKGEVVNIVLDKSIFYPEGGGQPSDNGEITGKKGKARVKHVRLQGNQVVHECTQAGELKVGENVTCLVDWELRFQNMRVHSAGHIVHDAVMHVSPYLKPIRGDHGREKYIEYEGSITQDKKYPIESKANEIVNLDLPIKTQFVSLEELKNKASYVPEHLPTNKPLRIVQMGSNSPVPDGGTQVSKTGEVGAISISEIENDNDHVRVHYEIEVVGDKKEQFQETSDASGLISAFLEVEREARSEIEQSSDSPDLLRIRLLGRSSELARLTSQLGTVAKGDRQRVGIIANQVKTHLEAAISELSANSHKQKAKDQWFDVTTPGIGPPDGHLHIVTQAISEITRIFERLGFTRVRHPEVDWDWYAFESLNMPPNHPARDEWETFFVDYPGKPGKDPHKQTMVLTPHTSNGQVREMEKGNLPIRMINIAKCYRRQSDVSHTPMFHQFEGMYIDKNVSIAHLKGIFDYFVKQFYGSDREIRLRPFHFQFTEPSFEVDISCGICHGSGRIDGQKCRLCKGGWLEMAGSGMIHPVVLKNGGVDPQKYSGFAFGWGIERAYMMKSGVKIDDLRLIYNNDIRFLEQF